MRTSKNASFLCPRILDSFALVEQVLTESVDRMRAFVHFGDRTRGWAQMKDRFWSLLSRLTFACRLSCAVTASVYSRIVVAAAVIGLAAATANGANFDYRTVPLKVHDFAPLAVSLPDWKVFEASDLGSAGKIRLADPTGGARMLEVSWGPGDEELDASTVAPALGRSGLVQLPSVALIAPLKGTVLRFATQGETKRLAISSLYCRSSNTTLKLTSFLNADWVDTVQLMQRIIGSVRCSTSSLTGPVFPKFVPRSGFKKVANSTSGVIYENEHNDMILFSSNQPPLKSMTQRELQTAAFKVLFEHIPSLRHVVTGDQVRRIGGKDIVFGGADDEDGTHVFLMATWWECATPRQAFYGGYLGTADPSATGMMELLASSQCP